MPEDKGAGFWIGVIGLGYFLGQILTGVLALLLDYLVRGTL